MPTFTIITATYNAAQTLPRLLESLATQTYRNFSVILQDGGSNDETLALAESYRSRLPLLSIESAPDNGIYDAWNKALDRAGQRLGDWVLFLGADDLLASNTVLEQTHKAMSTLAENIVFCGGGLQFFEESSSLIVDKLSPTIYAPMGTLPWRLRLDMCAYNPSLFYKKALFTHARFDTRYRIAGDYAFLAKYWKSPLRGKRLPYRVTCMANAGVSSAEQSQVLCMQEHRRVQEENFPIFTQYFRPFYNKIRALRH